MKNEPILNFIAISTKTHYERRCVVWAKGLFADMKTGMEQSNEKTRPLASWQWFEFVNY